MNIDLNSVEIAIVRTGGANLGRCYNQTNYRIYVCYNPDDKRYDDICTVKSAQKRERIADMLPDSNAGRHLGAFQPVPECPNIFVADAWIRIDSSD